MTDRLSGSNDSVWFERMRAQSARLFRAEFQSLGLFESAPILGPVDVVGDRTTLYVYDFIDSWGVDAAGVADALAQVETSGVLVRINSPGGDVFDGIAIHNLLRSSSKDVTVRVDGIAASIASVIALGSDRREIAVGAQFMVHDPWAVAAGNAADMRAFAELLEGQGANLADVYARRTGSGTGAEWRERMLADGDGTWYAADEAVGVGLATDLVDEDLEVESGPPVGAVGDVHVHDLAASAKLFKISSAEAVGDGDRSAVDERAARVANARKAIRKTAATTAATIGARR